VTTKNSNTSYRKFVADVWFAECQLYVFLLLLCSDLVKHFDMVGWLPASTDHAAEIPNFWFLI